jgi:hypothetical protein
MSIAGYVSVCVQLYCVGFHCFTTCFGLHGHLQVCRIFYFHILEGFCFAAFLPFFFTWSHKDRASRQTHIHKETTKITKENRKKTRNGNMQSVTTWKKAKKGSEAESFKHMKIKYPTHLEMAMQAETCGETVKTNTIKLHADGNITCNTHWKLELSGQRPESH